MCYKGFNRCRKSVYGDNPMHRVYKAGKNIEKLWAYINALYQQLVKRSRNIAGCEAGLFPRKVCSDNQ